MIFKDRSDFMEENELNLNDGGKVKGSGILKYIIIAIAVIIAIIVVVLIILLNQKNFEQNLAVSY